MILTTPQERKALLERSTSVAVVGASPKEDRPSHGVFAYLRAQRYDAVPINPAVAEVLGVRAFASLRDYAAQHGAPDIVDVFRKAEDVLPIVDEAIAVGARAIWFQLGIVNDEAIARADAAGLDVVVDRCIEIEHHALLS
ncbi:MAG: CoA-binding protein [bacterium]|nr:CoA-binding protein [bacterium]